MSRLFQLCFLLFVVCHAKKYRQRSSIPSEYSFEDRSSNGTVDEKILNLKSNSVVKLHVDSPSKSVSFAIVQAHSQIHSITLSRERRIEQPSDHVNGTSIGVLLEPDASSPGLAAYLFNPHPFNVTVLVFFMFYEKSAPIPGGCNQEFEMEVSPWLRVSYGRDMVSVEHELAALPPARGNPFGCETESLHYEIYQYYLSERDFSQESFFEGIRALRSVRGAQEYGREIRSFGFTPSTRSLFSLYPGVGRVFAVTVTYTGIAGNYPVSAYVPSVTYGCDLSAEGDCQSLNTIYAKIICALSIFVGLFVTFAGHRYFQIEMFLAGFVTLASVSYVVLVNHFEANVAGLAAGTSVMGLLGGLLWWFVWWFWGIPALSVLPVVLLLGFLMSSILFYLPISFEFLTNDFNFWSAFACCWLVLPVIFITFTRLGNIVSCAVIGSYAVIVPIDHYIGSSLKYIAYNVVRRATVRGFGRAVIDAPYQDNDIILTLSWVGLAISGVAFQLVRERKRPPFSPPDDAWRPWSWRRESGDISRSVEQSPLIVGAHASSSNGAHYGSA